MPLFIVSTPIGNLKDITLRAIDTLKESDLILAEDTRRTGILLKHYSISKPLSSFNDFNKEKKTPEIIKQLKDKNIALVSDAGTPGISDPGFYLIRESIKNNIYPAPIPGPTAAISALISSGFPTDSFVFYGFIPKKEKAKLDFLNKIKENNMTTIIYESPHRINKTIVLLNKIIPNRKICIARELTKKFEEIIIDYPKNLSTKSFKGEITVIISK